MGTVIGLVVLAAIDWYLVSKKGSIFINGFLGSMQSI